QRLMVTSCAIVSPIRTSSISAIGIGSYVFDEDVGRGGSRGVNVPVARSGGLLETEPVGVGAGGGADQGLDGASLGAVVSDGDHELEVECVVAFSYDEMGLVCQGRRRPGADVSDDADEAA